MKENIRRRKQDLVLSNANASLDVDLKYAKTMQTGASPALFVYTLPNIVIGEISIRIILKVKMHFLYLNSSMVIL